MQMRDSADGPILKRVDPKTGEQGFVQYAPAIVAGSAFRHFRARPPVTRSDTTRPAPSKEPR